MTFMEITACLAGMFFYLWSTLVLWYLMLRQFRLEKGPVLKAGPRAGTGKKAY